VFAPGDTTRYGLKQGSPSAQKLAVTFEERLPMLRAELGLTNLGGKDGKPMAGLVNKIREI